MTSPYSHSHSRYRSTSISSIASTTLSTNTGFVTPPESATELDSVFQPSPGPNLGDIDASYFDKKRGDASREGDGDGGDGDEQEVKTPETPPTPTNANTPRQSFALQINTETIASPRVRSPWFAKRTKEPNYPHADEDEEDFNSGSTPTKAELIIRRTSASSQGSEGGSPILTSTDPLLELGLAEGEVLSDDGSESDQSAGLLEDERDNDDWEEEDLERGRGRHGMNGHAHGSGYGNGDSAAMGLLGRSKAGRRKRKRRKWKKAQEELDRGGHKELWQLLAPQILSYPLILLPLLPSLPAAFLPGGAAIFIPLMAVVAGLSVCAQLVVVYLSRYLRVTTLEDVLHRSVGDWGLYLGRGLQITGILGTCVGWLRAVFPIWLTFIRSLTGSRVLASRWLILILGSILILPLPSRSKPQSGISLLPDLFALLLPIVIFTVIGRTVELVKSAEVGAGGSGGTEGLTGGVLARDDARMMGLGRGPFGMSYISSGSAILLVVFLFTPHIQTLPIHSTLTRHSRAWFPVPALIAATIILVLALPFTLVPYYLFSLHSTQSSEISVNRAGVFAIMQREDRDGWLNFARLCMLVLALTTANQWVAQARAIGLKMLGIEREGRAKAQRYLGIGIWAVIAIFTCIGGWTADKVEALGAICILAIAWLVPAILFVKNFYISNPLAIVFPTNASTTSLNTMPPLPTAGLDANLPRASSMDILLARKEEELQRRRTGRRLWQDLIVFVGILPIGLFTVLWGCGLFLGIGM